MFMDNNQENSSKSHRSKQILLLPYGTFSNSFGLTSPCLLLAKYEISPASLLLLIPFPFLLGKKWVACVRLKFTLPGVFDTGCLLLPLIWTTNPLQKMCCFQTHFLSLQWKWLLCGLFALQASSA